MVDQLHMSEFVVAFKRNCPRVNMTKAEGIELERLFSEAFEAGAKISTFQRATPQARHGGRMEMPEGENA